MEGPCAAAVDPVHGRLGQPGVGREHTLRQKRSLPQPDREPRGHRQSRSARLDQAALVGEDDRLDPVAQVQLGQHVGDVGLDRRLPDEELPGDLGVSQAAGDKRQHLGLALSQAIECWSANRGR